MAKREVKKDRVDIVIIVPKEDELRALEWAFEKDFGRSSGSLPGKTLFYKFKETLPTERGRLDISLAVVFLNDQGNSLTSSVTAEVYATLDPILIFLIGTAAGREGKVKIGHVVVSRSVDDVQEWRIEKKATPRQKQKKPPEKILADIGRFVGRNLSLTAWKEKLLDIPKKLYGEQEPPNELWKDGPEAHIKFVASGPNLQLNPDKLKEIWDLDDRILCYEMEGAGFATTCTRYSTWQWLVVRGISDYGTKESKKEKYRIAAAAAAAIFLRTFIKNGLTECHPYCLRVPESEDYTLPAESSYRKVTREDVISEIKTKIKNELNIGLEGIDFAKTLSLVEIESICMSRGADKTSTYDILSKIREDYFTKKYIDYTYQDDLRGLVPNWVNEIEAILSQSSINLNSCTVVDVGIGNGLEAPYLFTDAAKLVGADISKRMLKKAKKVFPTMETVCNSADKLHEIETSSIDIYISLRTYQSTLFDIPLSLHEAQRVLKRHGLVIVSIANGFVTGKEDKKKVIRGLLFPGSRDTVDKKAPVRLATEIWEKLTDLGFESVSIRSEKTDAYVWGRKP